MASAQAHADWISATGQGGHVGINGTYAVDRAAAAGYGGGATIFVNENWARGYGLSVSDCIYVSWNDPDHMGNMLATWHNEVGAGVSIDDQNRVTYILNVGHVSGSAPVVQPTDVPGQTQAPVTLPIQTVTPDSSGALIHTVREGESLWAIATAYNINLDALLALNGLTADSIIYAGDQIIIQLGVTPEPTQTESITPTSTLKPTITPRPTLTPFNTPIPTVIAEKPGGLFQRIFIAERLGILVALVGVLILGFVLWVISARRIR
jgi:LysM repeat protein